MNDLAVAYWESGQPAQAIPLYETALEKVRASLGDDHADTLTIIDNLAVAYAAAGQAGRAISLHETVLIRLKATLGENHLTTLVAMNNLARAYEAGLRHAESIELYEKTLPSCDEAQRRSSDRADVDVRARASLPVERPAFPGDRLVRSRTLGEAPSQAGRSTPGYPDDSCSIWPMPIRPPSNPTRVRVLLASFSIDPRRRGDSLPVKVRETIPRRQNYGNRSPKASSSCRHEAGSLRNYSHRQRHEDVTRAGPPGGWDAGIEPKAIATNRDRA